MRGTAIVASIVVFVGGACGGEGQSGSPGGSSPGPTGATPSLQGTTIVRPSTLGSTPGLPATTVLRPTTSGAPVPSISVIDVREPCPQSADTASASGEEMVAESTRLEPMLGQVLAYGGRHPDEFGSYGLVWHDGGDASVFISFTSDLDAHRVALEEIGEYPDELIVCQVAVSGTVADAIQATLVNELEGRFLSIGRGRSAIEVVLAPDEEALAGKLIARYGDAISVTVGALPYPGDPATSICPAAPAPNRLPGLKVAIVPPRGPLTTAGVEPFRLTVTLTNVGDSPVQFVSGTASGTILDEDGNVVSANNVALADLGIPVDLGPGESTELPLVASSSSCDPQLGYVIPPGNYRMIAEIQHSNGINTTLHSEPLPVEIGH
jgi:hypothetical protein